MLATSQATVPANTWTPKPSDDRSTVPVKLDPVATTFADRPNGPVQTPERSGGQGTILIVRCTCRDRTSPDGWTGRSSSTPHADAQVWFDATARVRAGRPDARDTNPVLRRWTESRHRRER